MIFWKTHGKKRLSMIYLEHFYYSTSDYSFVILLNDWGSNVWNILMSQNKYFKKVYSQTKKVSRLKHHSLFEIIVSPCLEHELLKYFEKSWRCCAQDIRRFLSLSFRIVAITRTIESFLWKHEYWFEIWPTTIVLSSKTLNVLIKLIKTKKIYLHVVRINALKCALSFCYVT